MSDKGLFTGCSVVGNSEKSTISSSRDGRAAGLALIGGKFLHGTIANNEMRVANGYQTGGGASMEGGVISHSFITNNYVQATDYSPAAGGGGVVVHSAGAVIANSYIAGNSTKCAGGGIYAKAQCHIVNCTVVGNESKWGGGIALGNSIDYKKFQIYVYNTIVSGNTATDTTSDGYPNWYCKSGYGNFNFDSILSPTLVTAQSKVNFVLDEPVFDATVAEGYPAKTSPSNNVGNDSAASGLDVDMTTDIAGNPRIAGSQIDIGCYEFQPPDFDASLAVSFDRTVPGSEYTITAIIVTTEEGALGYSWKVDDGSWSEVGSSSVLSQVFNTVGEHKVYLTPYCGGVAKDIVSCSVFVNSPVVTISSGGNLLERMSVIGGGTTVLLEPGVYEVSDTIVLDKQTVICSTSGAAVTEIRRVGTAVGQRGNIEQRVVRLANSEARIEGLTVSGGWLCSENAVVRHGAGVLVDSAGGQVISCTVTNNLSGPRSKGIGVACLSASGIVSNCLISANGVFPGVFLGGDISDTCGAGVYMAAGLLTHSRLTGNSLNTGKGSYYFGGGVFADGGRVSHCVIEGNDVWGSSYGASGGGGVALAGSAVLDNSLLFGNRVYQGFGGGLVIKDYNSSPTILNCTIVSNICERNADDVGGGVKNYSTSGAYCIQNCIVQGNLKNNAALAANDWSGESTTYVYYTLCPTFDLGSVNGNIYGKTVEFKPGSYRPAVVSTAGWKAGRVGSYGSYIGAGTTDLDGVLRESPDVTDLGCYVYVKTGLSIFVR